MTRKTMPDVFSTLKRLEASSWTLGVILLVCFASIAFKINAITLIPFVADEPDDLALLISDARNFFELFAVTAQAPDQSRLPHLISLPIAWAFQDNLSHSVIALRALFFGFHILYLFFSFKLVYHLTKNQLAAWGYVLLLLTSCYLGAFSIFSITTSDGLYLLFHIVSLYCFYLSWTEQRISGVFTHYVLLALLMGLCIASKLFGAFLLTAIFIFHVLFSEQRKTIRVRSLPPRNLLKIGLGFTIFIVFINAVSVSPGLKLGACALLGVGYLAYIGYGVTRELRNRDDTFETTKLWLWAAIILTSFNLTLIFSPIYLNFENLFGVFAWTGKWNHGLIVARSNWWDMPVIVLMKFGFISTGIMILIAGIYLYYHKFRIRSPFVILVGLVFGIHFITISVVQHRVVWYPMAIFPFLYLPWVWIWDRCTRERSRSLLVAAATAFFIVAGDNLWRYVRWYPYGHFDGAQYGREYIGWNRAGLISFEVLPVLDKFLARIRPPSDRPVFINSQLIYVPSYNTWITNMLVTRYASQFPHLKFAAVPLSNQRLGDIVLSSPIYNPDINATLRESQFQPAATLGVKGIEIITVWARSNPTIQKNGGD
ncbi:MAG: glycosyltransferase family 39 protein [Gammaproteobacteria bacterium]|nr:glycosyltransferase family 39 protein [Gammaproteobacteria bacterium]MDH3468407.1 glycosyltransferase family 39 protein [Gammaproteobacteria bacterium]